MVTVSSNNRSVLHVFYVLCKYYRVGLIHYTTCMSDYELRNPRVAIGSIFPYQFYLWHSAS